MKTVPSPCPSPLEVSPRSVGLGQRLRLGEWLGIGLGVVGVGC
jgi:hypothetical protein